jgi:hypothetical protein
VLGREVGDGVEKEGFVKGEDMFAEGMSVWWEDANCKQDVVDDV